MSSRGRRTRPDPSRPVPGSTTAPPELSAWLRGELGRVIRVVREHGLNPHNLDGPVILTRLGPPGGVGSVEDRTCDRCRTYVPPGPPLHLFGVRAAPQLIVTCGLCTVCAAHEPPLDTLMEGTP